MSYKVIYVRLGASSTYLIGSFGFQLFNQGLHCKNVGFEHRFTIRIYIRFTPPGQIAPLQDTSRLTWLFHMFGASGPGFDHCFRVKKMPFVRDVCRKDDRPVFGWFLAKNLDLGKNQTNF